jgi:hypothetical protein
MSLFKRLGRHARANVVAYLALFISLGGTGAYAANTIGSSDVIDESLLSQDFKNGEVKNADIGGNQVTTTKIKAGNVFESDLADGAVTGPKLATAPAASVLKLSAETTHSAAGTILHADYEVYDTANLHDTAGSTENLKAPVAGTYVISATVDWDPSNLGYRRTTILGNGGGPVASVAGPALPNPAYTSQNVSGIERLAAGQSVQVQVVQGSGSDLAARISRFEMTLVGGY